ncbi:MAG TPA: NAD(P)-dependent oxidoreductase [Gemmatimonadaceae bacterium]
MSATTTDPPRSEEALEERLSRPRAETVAALREAPGDLLVLGAGGKMGPSLARMAARAAADAGAGRPRRVVAVSRFGDAAARAALEAHGVETIAADLLDRAALDALPDAPNVVFMAGQKFGTSGAPSRTWAMNALVPATVAERFRDARLVAFSTGNVYPLTSVTGAGSREDDPPAPVGEYAMSCLARERLLEDAAARRGTRVAIVRLNYANDLRYGVLTDLAVKVSEGTPVPVAMGWVNVIWQGDANRIALECLPRAQVPPFVVNVTGAERLEVRALATAIGERLGIPPRFEGEEGPDALLSDTALMQRTFAPPELPAPVLLDWVSAWVAAGGRLLGKPTHFEERRGRF